MRGQPAWGLVTLPDLPLATSYDGYQRPAGEGEGEGGARRVAVGDGARREQLCSGGLVPAL